MKNPEDFSVVIIARNEEKTLPRLLKSLKGCLDIVLCDTGSTDSTVEVAKSLGCRIFSVGDKFRIEATDEQVKQWRDRFNEEPHFRAGEKYFHFANARNYAASLAKNDWVFQPDADEEMTWDLEKVREAIQDEDHLTYKFCYAHEPDGSCGLLLSQSKFYRKSKLRWTKWVHEVLQVIPGQNPKPPKWCDFIYHHHWQQPKGERSSQYLAGLELSVLENPEDDRNVYYLAREYFYTGDYKRSIQLFKKAIAIGAWPPEKNQAYTYKGLCHKLIGEIDKAVECFHKAMIVCDERREPFWELGNLYEEQKQDNRALVYYRAALAIPFQPHGYLSHKLLYGWKILDKIAYLYDKKGQKEEAKKYWLELLKHRAPASILKSGVEWFYQKDLPLVSIVIPTIRADGYERLIGSINRNTTYPNYEVIKKGGDKGTAIEKFNEGVEESQGEFIVYLADDCEVEPGWLIQAFVCFKENFRDRGLVILNDGYWLGRMANHFFCSKNIRKELDGKIWHSGYKHVGCDNELYFRLKKKDLVEFCPDAKIVHHHYCTQTRGTKAAQRDKYYRRIEKYQEADRELLYKRQKELGFGPKVAAFCTTHNEEVRIKEFVEENLKYVDEIYISDNGSTDRTVEIAERAGAKVRQSGLVCTRTPEEYVEGEIKQKALEFAQESDCEWFLYLDADEILEERAKDILPALINDQRYDSYGMRKPTFWLGRTHYRIDSDFGRWYLDRPYPLKLWNRNAPIKMTIAPRGAHSYPAVDGDPNKAFPEIRHKDCEIRVKHYSFDTREEALKKYNMYRNVDPIAGMSRTTKKYDHLHPDFLGIKLKKWVDNPKK